MADELRGPIARTHARGWMVGRASGHQRWRAPDGARLVFLIPVTRAPKGRAVAPRSPRAPAGRRARDVMTVVCVCGRPVTIKPAPTFGVEAYVDCRCGARYDATPGRSFGRMLQVCDGFQPPPPLRVLPTRRR